MEKLLFPLLRPDQIEVRVGQVVKSGFTLLLYKTARTDAEILDEVVGQGNWQKKFYTLEGVGIGDKVRSIVVCSVGIFDKDKNMWVWKDDSGTEGDIEQDKSICSDAFKRASGGSCWGIGRELYYTGRLFVSGGVHKNEELSRKYGKDKYELDDPFARYEVSEITWEEKPLKLKTLVIVANDKEVICIGKRKQKETTYNSKGTFNTSDIKVGDDFTKECITKEQLDAINTFYERLSASSKERFMQTILSDKYNVPNATFLTKDQAQEIITKYIKRG